MPEEQNFLAGLTASRPFRAPPSYSLQLPDHAALDSLHVSNHESLRVPDQAVLPVADSLHAPGHAALEAADGAADEITWDGFQIFQHRGPIMASCHARSYFQSDDYNIL